MDLHRIPPPLAGRTAVWLGSFMSLELLKPVSLLLPTGALFAGAIVLVMRRRRWSTFLQAVGAGCLVLVVLAHLAEAVHAISWMGWGLENSPGHYLDLGSAILGFVLFPAGYLLDAIERRAG